MAIVKDKNFLGAVLIITALFAGVVAAKNSNNGNKIFAESTEVAWEDVYIQRVSVASDGTEGNQASRRAFISSEGQYITFTSFAFNLVSNDNNGFRDAFVHDRETGTTERVSVGFDGSEANNVSDAGPISTNGRYIALNSAASNLIPSDTNGFGDTFVYDREADLTQRVSVGFDGSEANSSSGVSSISAEGIHILMPSFASNLVSGDTNNVRDIFVHNRIVGVTERVSVASDGSQANGESQFSSMSPDGRYVAFDSNASNLIPNDGTKNDVFVHDRATNLTERISIASDGTAGNHISERPSISANGRYVAFRSLASNLVLNDTNNTYDIFVHDRETGTTERVSIASDGTQHNSQPGGASVQNPSISGDGRYVAFSSDASNLVPGDTNDTWDVFVHDREIGITQRVSVDFNGTQANGRSEVPSFSTDGRYVVFESDASNLVLSDNNNARDVFVAQNPLFAPQTPEEQTAEIIEDIGDLIDEGILNEGEANSLISKLENVLKSLEKENENAAINQLSSFINEVNALLNSGRLTETEAQALIEAAENAIELIGEG